MTILSFDEIRAVCIGRLAEIEKSINAEKRLINENYQRIFDAAGGDVCRASHLLAGRAVKLSSELSDAAVESAFYELSNSLSASEALDKIKAKTSNVSQQLRATISDLDYLKTFGLSDAGLHPNPHKPISAVQAMLTVVRLIEDHDPDLDDGNDNDFRRGKGAA